MAGSSTSLSVMRQITSKDGDIPINQKFLRPLMFEKQLDQGAWCAPRRRAISRCLSVAARGEP
jgi:hypothetical protein